MTDVFEDEVQAGDYRFRVFVTLSEGERNLLAKGESITVSLYGVKNFPNTRININDLKTYLKNREELNLPVSGISSQAVAGMKFSSLDELLPDFESKKEVMEAIIPAITKRIEELRATDHNRGTFAYASSKKAQLNLSDLLAKLKGEAFNRKLHDNLNAVFHLGYEKDKE